MDGCGHVLTLLLQLFIMILMICFKWKSRTHTQSAAEKHLSFKRAFWWFSTLCYGIALYPPKGTFLDLLFTFCGHSGFQQECFILHANPRGWLQLKKRKNKPKTKTKITSWNCSRVLYIALFLCYRVNLRNLWQEVGQMSCLCAVTGNKQNSNEVKRKENKHIDKQMLQR